MTANTSYKSFSQALVDVDIGLHVGLAGVNVTLVGESDVLVCSSGAAVAPGGLQVLCGWPWSARRLLGPCCPPQLLGHSRTSIFSLWQETQ